jgi:hypothetical protein
MLLVPFFFFFGSRHVICTSPIHLFSEVKQNPQTQKTEIWKPTSSISDARKIYWFEPGAGGLSEVQKLHRSRIERSV